MKRFFCALLGASMLAFVAPLSAAAFTPQTTVATRALDWIQRDQLGADGSVGSDPTRTEEVVWGLVANHRPIATFVKTGSTATPVDYLRANLLAEEKAAGNVAQLILAVTAAGEDPTSFGPTDSKRNLLADLQADYHTATGEYGPDNVFDHILSILALRSANQTPPAAAITFLKSQQKDDGGWSYDNADQFGTDTNTTALALVALASSSALDGCLVSKALNFLKAAQQADGGFPFQASYPVSDPDSDGFAIEGILAAGQDPTDAAWTKTGNKDAVTNLVAFQGEDGSFSFPGVGTDNLLATTQPLVALASTHLPLTALGTSFAAPSVPMCQQSAASPSPTPTPTPTGVVHLAPTGSPAAHRDPDLWLTGVPALGLIAILAGWRLRRRVR